MESPTSIRWSTVELVDVTGTALGTAPVVTAHEAPGKLHRAFSVLLDDGRGNVLLQRRSSAKTRFALRWGNTCCGHPEPGGDLLSCAARRLQEEMGLKAKVLFEAGVFTYRASDPATGLEEYEYDHVVGGRAGGVPFPDPAEVDSWTWFPVKGLVDRIENAPEEFTPWLIPVLRTAQTI